MQAAETIAFAVRPSVPEDRVAIYDILMRSEVFGRSDAECVDEMFLETWETPKVDSYRWLSCVRDDKLAGFACYGTESLTQDTWDMFWICVLPEARGKGVGRALIAEAETQARQANGRLMVIYTSSMPKYGPARALYERTGFIRVAVVADYYRDGDDLYIYTKRLRS